MTIASEQGRQAYLGAGTADPLPVPFKFFQNSDLTVIEQSSSGVDTTLTESVHYTVTGAGNEAGGSVTPSAPIAVGKSWSIILNPLLKQETDYVSNDAFAAESHERALDRLTQQNIRTRDIVSRALRQPDGDSTQIAALPGRAARAGKYVAFDSSGNPIASVGTGNDSALRTDLAAAGGALLVGYQHSGAGAVARTVAAKLRESASIADFGGVVAVDAAGALALAAAAVKEVVFPSGAWVINSVPAIPTGTVLRAMPGATFSGAGAISLGLPTANPSRETRVNYSTSSTDYAGFELVRNAAHTGGSSAFVASNLLARTVTGANVTNNEWAATFILDNHTPAPVAGHVAMYAQGNKYTGAGLTWAAVAEARDRSGDANPTSGLVAIEVDVFADGTDNNDQRVGIDLVGGVGVAIGPFIGYGIRIGPQDGNTLNCTFKRGVHLYGVHERGLSMALAAGSTCAIDLSASTLTGSALRLAQNQFIAFDAGDNERLSYDGTGIAYRSGGNLRARLNDTGSLLLAAVSASANAGAGGALPATVQGYFVMYDDTGTERRVPYFAV